jgi:NAD-dependent SIR2 family protein deacetylase
MTRLTCTDCHRPIPNGKAFLRSESLRQIALCPRCQAKRDGVLVDDVRFERPMSEVIAEARRSAH